jgi:FkbM family methyltransferase
MNDNLFMQSILRRVRTKYYKWTERSIHLPISQEIPTVRIGTPYGGWIVPENQLNDQSVCYLVGAGEDVSFDIGLTAKYGCPAHIFDPTPRAIQHVEQLKANLLTGAKTACATSPDGFYPIYPPELSAQLHMHPYGIWNEDTVLRFFSPPNAAYVSHSIVNLQQSEHFIEVPVKTLKTVMQELGHTRINLLKIDIEGAEYQVIESIIQDKIDIETLCIEFDESAANHFDGKYISRIENALKSLINIGFTIIAKESNCHNYTLFNRRNA